MLRDELYCQAIIRQLRFADELAHCDVRRRRGRITLFPFFDPLTAHAVAGGANGQDHLIGIDGPARLSDD
jgi:hypothetical protein